MNRRRHSGVPVGRSMWEHVPGSERGQTRNQCTWGGRLIKMRREMQLETGHRQVAEELDCLINVFLFYGNCGESWKVLGKGDFVTSLASVPRTDRSRD